METPMSDLTALREAWEHEFCENGLRRGNCGCQRCLDDLLRRGVAHGIELAMAEVEHTPVTRSSMSRYQWVDQEQVLARLATLKGRP